ncbi:MAG: SGNH/GDSL hydrolase family protein [Acetobacteraceae bacterium]
MATLQSLIDAVNTVSDIVPSNLVSPPAPPMQFADDGVVNPPAGGFSAVYAFGDSLSDAGNVSALTLRNVPVSPPYAGGVFSNGPVWVQQLSQEFGLPPVKASLTGGTDYAYGGARTGAIPGYTPNPSDLPSQLGQFAANVPNPSADALYTVWIGANDMLDVANDTSLTAEQRSASVQQAVSNEVGFVNNLISLGAQHVMVLNLPNLGQTPYEVQRGPDVAAQATATAQEYNTLLADQLQDVVATSGVDLQLVDTFTFLDTAIATPGAYGLTNVTDPLWTGNITDPNSGTLQASGDAQAGYLFFDTLHPSGTAHALLAATIADQVSVPA